MTAPDSPKPSRYLLGVDGGGSKTRAVIATEDGTILGSGLAGASNYQSVGWDAATEAVRQAVADARLAAGYHGPLAAAGLGLAGVDRPADRAIWHAWLERAGLVERWTLHNDAELILAAGASEGWGVALICGTGSIAYGRAPDGRTERAGGWGHLLGDEGSGYDLGIQTLRMATQTADGRLNVYSILNCVLDHWGMTSAEQLIPYVYRPEMTRAEIASLARPVVALAAEGDEFATELVDGAVAEVVRQITTVMRKLQLPSPPITLGGGLAATWFFQRRLALHLESLVQSCVFVDEPARGGVVLGSRLLADPIQQP